MSSNFRPKELVKAIVAFATLFFVFSGSALGQILSWSTSLPQGLFPENAFMFLDYADLNPCCNDVVIDSANGKAYLIAGNYAALPPVLLVTDMNGSILNSIVLPAQSVAIGLNSATGKLYIAQQEGGGVNGFLTVFDTASSQLLPAIPLSTPVGYNGGFAINDLTNKIYVGPGTNAVAAAAAISIVDVGANQVTTLTLPGPSEAIAVDDIANRVYIPTFQGTNPQFGTLVTVDGSTDQIISTLPLPPGDPNIAISQSNGIAVNSVTHKIYLLEEGSFITVWVVDGVTNQISSVALPNSVNFPPFGIAVDTTTNRVYMPAMNCCYVSSLETLFGDTNNVANFAFQAQYTFSGGIAVDSQTHRLIAYGQDMCPGNASGCIMAIDPGASTTSAGSNVSVQADQVQLTFSSVTSAGTTSATAIDPSSVGQIPGGFAVSGSVAYQLSSTATFSGPVTIAFTVPGPISQQDFNSLRVLHNVSGTLVDVTASSPAPNYSTLTIYATTNSFSPFYLIRQGLHVSPLFNQSGTYKAGSTIPIKLQILDPTGANVSSSSLTVNARSLLKLSNNISSNVISSGNANPDNNFRFDSTIGTTGGYIFNLSTKSLSAGTYALSFYVGGDKSFLYTVAFQVQ